MVHMLVLQMPNELATGAFARQFPRGSTWRPSSWGAETARGGTNVDLPPTSVASCTTKRARRMLAQYPSSVSSGPRGGSARVSAEQLERTAVQVHRRLALAIEHHRDALADLRLGPPVDEQRHYSR
jgi:hypothetical protein